ncbi:MAG: PAS domain-containing methyl-accepting chemotaxis protein [Rhodocyclaceae bacterium]|nr:methyl-accepting chemotaxis protein [Rhodocyclaceae bacterium]
MKINMPVTGEERHLRPGRPIVTKTDLKGLITYANAAFVEISGFRADELIGKNHNVVRHPDMPPEAFADLWATLKAGQPWRGLVKNRCKDGAFYWVDAFVTPICESGRTVGYMSVRSAPARASVTATESLYARVRDKQTTFPRTARVGSLRRQHNTIWALTATSALFAAAAAWLDGGAGAIAGAVAAGLSIATASYYQLNIGMPLERLGAHISALDEGRLEQGIDTPRRGLARPFAQLEAMRIHLRAMFADVLVAARDVDERSRELEGAVHDLSEATALQGERVMQVAAAMEEMSASVNEIAGNTEMNAEAAQATEEAVSVAMRSMSEGIRSSEAVVNVVDAARLEIERVNASVEKIGEVSRIIREIAEQTNLLALNAAIEAARAGEQGRGFAVVADEVRKLAERTAASTTDIAGAVALITSDSETAVGTMQSAAGKVSVGTKQINESSASLQEIRAASIKASGLSTDIRQMLDQQASASHEVAAAMEAISTSVESNNASVDQVGTAAGQLRATAGELRALIQHLERSLG